MGVGEALEALGAAERLTTFDEFSAAIDPRWIAEALAPPARRRSVDASCLPSTSCGWSSAWACSATAASRRSCSISLSSRRARPARAGRKLFIGNLGFDVNHSGSGSLVAQAGTCESAAVVTDRDTGRSRGFGFVEMASNGEAQKAIQQFDGQEFKGRTLKVNEAREREGGGPRGGGVRGRY
jgi:RNA recognition motif-containing protein